MLKQIRSHSLAMRSIFLLSLAFSVILAAVVPGNFSFSSEKKNSKTIQFNVLHNLERKETLYDAVRHGKFHIITFGNL